MYTWAQKRNNIATGPGEDTETNPKPTEAWGALGHHSASDPHPPLNLIKENEPVMTNYETDGLDLISFTQKISLELNVS